MLKHVFITIYLCICCVLLSCQSGQEEVSANISKLKFIGEQVLPYNYEYQETVVGGLSSIDYAEGVWYLLSDDKNNPRFYTASLEYNNKQFNKVEIKNKTLLKDTSGRAFSTSIVDPEALRIDLKENHIVWTSEGYTNKGINPFVRLATLDGSFLKGFALPQLFKVSDGITAGPRNNGVFEGLCLDNTGNGYWVSLEEPLIQDGEEATFSQEQGDSPIRISYINKNSGSFDQQYAYQLDKVARQPIPSDAFSVNGVVELLALSDKLLLVLERSYAVGYNDGGNNVKIYLADLSKASEISALSSLKDVSYRPVKKNVII